jgi:hypothetical protein
LGKWSSQAWRSYVRENPAVHTGLFQLVIANATSLTQLSYSDVPHLHHSHHHPNNNNNNNNNNKLGYALYTIIIDIVPLLLLTIQVEGPSWVAKLLSINAK